MADPKQILKDLKSGKYLPIYFLHGEEPFYIDAISDYVESHCIEESQKGFNQTLLYGKDVDMNTVMAQAKRFPMMSERQVVIIKEAQEIKDINNEHGGKLLLDYINNPLTSTVLVLAYKNKKLDKRKAVAKTLSKTEYLIESKKLYDDQVPDWVSSYIKEKGFNIGQKALQVLVESVGSEISKLSNEVDKTILNLKKGEEITADHIQKYIGVSKDYNVFELQKALGTKDVLKANKIINYFEKNPKSNPLIPTLALIYSYFSKILISYGVKDQSDGNLARALGVSPYFLKDYKIAKTKYSAGKLIRIFSYLREADLRVKGVSSGNLSDADILRELVFKITH